MKHPGWIYLAAFALWACAACSAGTPAPREGHAAPPSIVALLDVARAQPLSSSDRDQLVPTCSAFAVLRSSRVELATAAHCVVSEPVEQRFYAPSGWGYGHAKVAQVLPGDIAFLEPADPGALTPFGSGPSPTIGDSATSESAVWAGVSSGYVSAELGSGWFETSQSVVFGWSGSPVLGPDGKAWGIVSRCHVDETSDCLPGHAIIAVLPAE